MSIDSTDFIKRRMIRNASKIWGYKDVQDINSFDPVLSLIFGAMAHELHNISTEINKTEGRIIERLLELLFTQNIYTHFPAHAIAMAKPLQAVLVLNENYQFHYTKSIYNPENKEVQSKKNIYFTPVSRVKLLKGQPKFLLTGKNLYEIDNQYKEIIVELPSNNAASYSSIFIGLQMDPSIDILDGLSLYFSFKSLRSGDPFFQLLRSATWKISGEKVNFRSGFLSEQTPKTESIIDFVKNDNNASYKACKQISCLYEKNFMTLAEGSYSLEKFIQKDYSPIAESILGEYSNIDLKNVIWIEICSSQPFSAEVIDDLSISMNCYPVMNRELNELSYSARKGTNVIPLLTDDLFFDVKKVCDSGNHEYNSMNSMNADSNETPSYVIRQSGISRFDFRNAHEMINDLLFQVKDEAAAFSIIGGDLVRQELKQLDQIISRLNHRLESKINSRDQNSYLLFDSKVNYEKISVEFWSTVGEMANQIRPGSKLKVDRGYDIDDKSIVLLSQTSGGRQKLSKDDKLNTLRKELLSKGKIITKGDIKALCIQLFGSELKSVEIKKDVYLDPSSTKGYIQSLDVHLELVEKVILSDTDVIFKVDELLFQLKEQSMNLLPYRIFINGDLNGQSF